MNELMNLDFEGTPVRVITADDGTPRWALADVCTACGIANPRNVAARLDNRQKGVVTMDTLGGPQKITVVNEDGLYDVILDSRKPEARRFRKWVTSEVLPSIRKHGAYMTPDTIREALADPDTLIMLATRLKEETERGSARRSRCANWRPRRAHTRISARRPTC
ncbi:BRO-N domain-containing protein [Bifidobacterium pseudolongum]|uniref:BRO-N domain-containing protein n=1 Tax=Bifidobacterium pseudolongum TaxID=1694 RepID=UPI00209E1093|nr:Bro-N domain-containing protein [Bifidobacterium pseudolongum]